MGKKQLSGFSGGYREKPAGEDVEGEDSYRNELTQMVLSTIIPSKPTLITAIYI